MVFPGLISSAAEQCATLPAYKNCFRVTLSIPVVPANVGPVAPSDLIRAHIDDN
jgi:hypothetical protein